MQKLRPIGQVVKTSPSHGEIRGSTPLWVTRKRDGFLFIIKQRNRLSLIVKESILTYVMEIAKGCLFAGLRKVLRMRRTYSAE